MASYFLLFKEINMNQSLKDQLNLIKPRLKSRDRDLISKSLDDEKSSDVVVQGSEKEEAHSKNQTINKSDEIARKNKKIKKAIKRAQKQMKPEMKPENLLRAQEFAKLTPSERRVESAVFSANLSKPSRDLDEEKKVIGNIRLISRRGEKYNSKITCDECGGVTSTAWKYLKTNRGEVYLCSRCKPYVFNRSFGSTDALDHAETGGFFEGNRSRH
jgi:hypothetical protein